MQGNVGLEVEVTMKMGGSSGDFVCLKGLELGHSNQP